MGFAQLVHILRRRANRDRGRMVEPVVKRDRPAGNPRDLERHHVLAEQRDNHLQRAHPPHAFGLGRPRPPAHRLGPPPRAPAPRHQPRPPPSTAPAPPPPPPPP